MQISLKGSIKGVGIFGPSKLTEIGKSLGKALGEFKSQANRVTDKFAIYE